MFFCGAEIFQKVAGIFQKVNDFLKKTRALQYASHSSFYFIWFLSVFLVFNCFSKDKPPVHTLSSVWLFEKQVKTRKTEKNKQVGCRSALPLR